MTLAPTVNCMSAGDTIECYSQRQQTAENVRQPNCDSVNDREPCRRRFPIASSRSGHDIFSRAFVKSVETSSRQHRSQQNPRGKETNAFWEGEGNRVQPNVEYGLSIPTMRILAKLSRQNETRRC